MWIGSQSEVKLLFVVLSLSVLSTLLFLNFQSAFSQSEDVSYLDVNSTSSAQLSKFSVAAWFKTSTDFSSNAFIVNKAGASDNMNYGIWMNSAEKISAGYETPNGIAIFATSPLSYSDDKWHYAVVTFDGSTISLYLDGLPVATKAASGAPDSGGEQPIRLGANSDALSNFFVGNVDEIRVWKAALSAQQVIDAFNGNFNTHDQIEYLDFTEPIVPVNNTIVNGTLTNQTGFQDVNGTVTNNTGILSAPLVSNETNTTNDTDNNIPPVEVPQITNDTDNNIPPVEVPQITNDTGISNDTGAGTQQTPPPEENNSPEASDQSVSVDQNGQVEINLIASDKDNDPLQFDITADPLQGSLVDFDKDKGTVTYVAQNGFFGDDKFFFKVTDDKGSESNTAQVKVNVKETTQSAQNEENTQAKIIENTTNNTDEGNTNLAQQPNLAPKADAGDNQKVEVNTEVKLDASESSDEDGKIAAYKWEQTDGPEVDIKKADEQTANFDVPETAADSKLVFKLTVTDDKGDSASDDVTIDVAKVQNVPPKADAGDNQKVKVNTEVKLDGSKSSDEDGKIAAYKWEQTDGPEVDIKKADEQTANFDVPETAADSKLVFKLTVTDDKGDSASDDVTIEVQKIAEEKST